MARFDQIIALRGPSGSGKSTILLMLAERLVTLGWTVISEGPKIKRGKDRWFVFEKGKHKIGLTTRGDTPGALNYDFKLIAENTLQICICACHTKDLILVGTNAMVRQWSTREPVFLEKSINKDPSTFEMQDREVVSRLLETLQSLLEQIG